MNKQVIILVLVITFVLVGGGVFLVSQAQPKPIITGLDDFAKCLTAKGAVMYGAAWCVHCQKVKKDFGDSFKYINYVECPVETKICTEKNIEGYPTWIFADGQRLSGEQPFEKFAEITQCPYKKT